MVCGTSTRTQFKNRLNPHNRLWPKSLNMRSTAMSECGASARIKKSIHSYPRSCWSLSDMPANRRSWLILGFLHKLLVNSVFWCFGSVSYIKPHARSLENTYDLPTTRSSLIKHVINDDSFLHSISVYWYGRDNQHQLIFYVIYRTHTLILYYEHQQTIILRSSIHRLNVISTLNTKLHK